MAKQLRIILLLFRILVTFVCFAHQSAYRHPGSGPLPTRLDIAADQPKHPKRKEETPGLAGLRPVEPHATRDVTRTSTTHRPEHPATETDNDIDTELNGRNAPNGPRHLESLVFASCPRPRDLVKARSMVRLC